MITPDSYLTKELWHKAYPTRKKRLKFLKRWRKHYPDRNFYWTIAKYECIYSNSIYAQSPTLEDRMPTGIVIFKRQATEQL